MLNAADGRRSCAEIAEVVGRGLGRSVTEDNVRTLVDSHLRPLGLLKRADGSEPELKQSNPLLGLKPRIAVTNPRTTRRLTDPFQVLFRPVVAAAILPGFVMVVGWVFFEHGLGASAYDAFERPQLLLLVFVVTVLSGGFHEFGHAAAARYSGAQPGTMGAGLYLVWPAFYTDVTDSYRLGRAGRIRTDLGGLYFNTIVVALTFVWWWATGWEALLLLVATQVLQMMQQLLPLLRFDGYHLLADLAGVPDLYHRIRPTLRGAAAPLERAGEQGAHAVGAHRDHPLGADHHPDHGADAPRADRGRAAAAGDCRRGRTQGCLRRRRGVEQREPHRRAAHSLQVMGVVLPVLACAMVLGRIGIRWFKGLARWSGDCEVNGSWRPCSVPRWSPPLLGLVAAPRQLRADPAGGDSIFTNLQEPQTAPSDALPSGGQGCSRRPEAARRGDGGGGPAVQRRAAGGDVPGGHEAADQAGPRPRHCPRPHRQQRNRRPRR